MMIPPMGQASLGIEIVSSNSEVREIALTLNDEDTHLLTKLERELYPKLGLGSSTWAEKPPPKEPEG